MRDSLKIVRFSRTCVLLTVMLLLSDCGSNGPITTRTVSAGFPSLQAKIDFLNQYVTFRRTYETLDFSIQYINGGNGTVPGPSTWDIRLVATVPESELKGWLLSGPPVTAPDTGWLKVVQSSINLSGLSEWYVEKGRVVGIDRKCRIVAYRAWAE